MARQQRIHPPGGIHHITARGNDRQPIFHFDADRQSMMAIVEEAVARQNCRLLAFCLMDNHVHFTMQDVDGNLSKALKHVNGVYAQRFNRRHNRTGHLFGGRFWSSLIETDSYLATAVEYVHLNPVAAGMVERPADYRWSSYRSYVGLERPEPFLDMELVLGLYGGDRKFLREQTERSNREPAKDEQLGKSWPDPVLGSEEFVRQHLPTAEVEPRRATPDQVVKRTLDQVVEAVAAVCAVDPTGIRTARSGSKNQPRMLAIHIAASIGVVPNRDVADYFSLAATHSVSSTSRRCRRAVAEDSKLAAQLQAARNRLPRAARAA